MFSYICIKQTDMVHFKLTEHTEKCKQEKREYELKTISSNKDLYFLHNFYIPCQVKCTIFFIKGEFIIIEHSSCSQHLSNYLDFQEFLIKKCLSQYFNPKKKLIYNVKRSCQIGKNWKNERSRNILFNESHEEVNHIYYDNASKQYAICTTYDFGTYLSNRIDLTNEYYETVEYIKNNIHDNECILDKCQELYVENRVVEANDQALVVRSIDELISNIKTKIK